MNNDDPLQGDMTTGSETGTDTGTGTGTGPDVSDEQRGAIETMVYRTVAHDLERVLSMRLATVEEIEDDDEAGADDERTEEDEEDDAPFDDEFYADPEGDFAENDEPPLLLDSIGLDTPEKPDHRADVVIERIDTSDGKPRLLVRSGIADLLLRLRGRDSITGMYHQFLRQRIRNTLLIVARIVNENRDYFLQKTDHINRLRRDELRQTLGMNKERLSRVLSSTALLTPWGEKIELQPRFIARSTTNLTDKALLRVFAEHWEDEQKEPLSDVALADYVDTLLNGDRPRRSTVRAARSRLGIPNADERRKQYQQGRGFVTMIAQGLKGIDRLRSLQQLLTQLLPGLKNEQVRDRAQGWLKQAKEYLERE